MLILFLNINYFQWYGHCYQYLNFTMDCWGWRVHFQSSILVFCGWKKFYFGQIFHAFYVSVYSNCPASILPQWRYWIQDWFGYKWVSNCSKKCFIQRIDLIVTPLEKVVIFYLACTEHAWRYIKPNPEKLLKIFLILYPPLENSTTRIAIM